MQILPKLAAMQLVNADVNAVQVAGQLFGVTVEAADGKAPVWNSDVRFFCIKQDGKPRAYFFFVSLRLCPLHAVHDRHQLDLSSESAAVNDTVQTASVASSCDPVPEALQLRF